MEFGEDDILVEVGGRTFVLTTAEDDFNPEKKTLFATFIWNGAKVLAAFLLGEGAGLVQNKSVIELGAGAALPSLSAGVSGARFVCCTDYPIQGLLDNMRRNIERNVDPGMIGIYHVAGYRWGEDCRHLVELNSDLYDVVLAAECLWRHDSHEVLLRTLKMVLTRGGLAIFTFSHHIPGLEQNDLNFFEMAKGDGFQVVSETVQEAPHMWSDRLVPLKMVILKLTID